MKKYIITEDQVKRIIDILVDDQLTLTEQHRDILSLADVAELISRTGNDYNTLLEILQDEFRDKGDEGVQELFKEATGVELDVISTGKYVIKF